MSFTIKIQRNNSDNIALTKDITDILTLDGVLKDDTSIINPSIVFEGNITQVANANYMTIPSFNRSYFITDVISMTNNLFQVNAHVDVLSSFATEIRANKGIVARQENEWNLYINDGLLKQYENPIIATQPFPNGFTTYEYVLAVAGRGGEPAYDTEPAPTPEEGQPPLFTPYVNVHAVRDESQGECTEYVVNRTQQALGIPCVYRYGNAEDWMDSTKTGLSSGWTRISSPSPSDIRAGDVLVWSGNLGHVAFVEDFDGTDVVLSQSNVRNPGGTYSASWHLLIAGRKYRFSCVDIPVSSISSYLGLTLIGIIRYTGL